MNKIDDEKHNELIVILSELIETIELMKKEEKQHLLRMKAGLHYIELVEKMADFGV